MKLLPTSNYYKDMLLIRNELFIYLLILYFMNIVYRFESVSKWKTVHINNYFRLRVKRKMYWFKISTYVFFMNVSTNM